MAWFDLASATQYQVLPLAALKTILSRLINFTLSSFSL
jgi:hypothetical protein